MKADIDKIIQSLDNIANTLDNYFYKGSEFNDIEVLSILYELRSASSWLRVLYGQGDTVES